MFFEQREAEVPSTTRKFFKYRIPGSIQPSKKKNKQKATKSKKTEGDEPASKQLKMECLPILCNEKKESKSKKTRSINNNAVVDITSNALNEDMDKKLTITSSDVYDFILNSKENSEGTCKNQNFLDVEQLPQVALKCKMVAIGSYMYIPREKVVISHSGVRFSVPLLEDDTRFVTLDVDYSDIISLLIHFEKPVLFFNTSTSSGAKIRKLLKMHDPKGSYYDPTEKDHTRKRITLLLSKLTEDSITILTTLFSREDKIIQLSLQEAKDIYLRTVPKDKLSQNLQANVTEVDNIQTLTIYPPPPAKGGIAINTKDYLCLAKDEFLNDVIIDFYLTYLTLEVLSESDRHRTHVFSSHFYQRLSSPHVQATENASHAATQHARVQKWTKNVNIFEKDFVIIPINKHAHWFLAIICFPGLVGKVLTCSEKTSENDSHKTVQKKNKIKKKEVKIITIGSTLSAPVTTIVTRDQLNIESEKDEAEGDDKMKVDSDEDDETDKPEEKKTYISVKLEKEIVKTPCILIFDSIAGTNRTRLINTLRDYLSCEYVAKFGIKKTFSQDTIKEAYPKVPQQSNYTDCGLYVLQYVESFFKNPIKDYSLPIETLKTWFEEIVVTRKREELSNLLVKLMNDTKDCKTINLPTVKFPTKNGKLKPKIKNRTDLNKIAQSIIIE